MTLVEVIKILDIISLAISCILFFKYIPYVIIGLFATRRFQETDNKHKYAILIAARNEQAVIGNLLDTIKDQDYPAELITAFVVADNCTDDTAKVARERGAIVYERFDDTKRTKGYALQFLVEEIRRDYGIMSYDGYIIFDADNLLKRDYISRMNESYDAGEKIICSYRNTKNFNDNCISASYALHWMRTIRVESRARSLLHLATRIQGTGFLVASEILEDGGWRWLTLTEDRKLCADSVVNGYKISYNDRAEFYDEQPTKVKVALRQRIRWAKGHLQAFVETGPSLFAHQFVTGGVGNARVPEDTPKSKRLFNNLRVRFMSLDMLGVAYPRWVVTVFKKMFVFNVALYLILSGQGYNEITTVGAFLLSYLIAFAEAWLSSFVTAIYNDYRA